MKRVILIFTWLFFFKGLEAQPPSTFFRLIGGDGIDIGYSIKETPTKFYIVAGSTSSYGYGGTDAYLILLDTMGQIVWDRTYGGTGNDVAKSVIFNPSDSGFIFTGFTNSIGNGGYDVFVARIDKAGKLLWQQGLGGFDWDFGNDLIFANDGNIILCGNSYGGPYPKIDGYLAKVNINNGAPIWQKYMGGNEDDDFLKILLTSDGYYSVVGNTQSYGDINNDFWLCKINQNGDSIFSKSVGNPNKKEVVYDFIEDKQQKLVFCGAYDTSAANSGKTISYILKTDLNGTFDIETKYSGSLAKDDKILSVSNSLNNDVYFFSRKYSNSSASSVDIEPILTTSGLVFIQAKTHGEPNDDIAFETSNTLDDGYLMVGYTLRDSQKAEDIYIIKLNNALDFAPQVVGLNKVDAQDDKLLYYYNNAIYLYNPGEEMKSYDIYNSNGIKVQSGVTRDKVIKLNPELPNDIYIIIFVDSKSIKLKFIKN